MTSVEECNNYRIVFNASNELELKAIADFINKLKMYKASPLFKCVVDGREVNLNEEVVEFKWLAQRKVIVEVTLPDNYIANMNLTALTFGLLITHCSGILSSVTKF